MKTIIVKNTAGEDLDFEQLSIDNQILQNGVDYELSATNSYYDISTDDELTAYIQLDKVILNVDGVDLSKTASLDSLEPSTVNQIGSSLHDHDGIIDEVIDTVVTLPSNSYMIRKKALRIGFNGKLILNETSKVYVNL